ncbi:VOC family protein [Bradyrhizobium sp. NBAIM32]|uniref:VOC family protein n=1 Tax=Bradyrhizobium sp. NBAIM32 TaxID=2793809 RepID=UPI001CD5AAF6|nr:VOC family protein [Bradyrhizobium sp. NBAIM32]MCA1544885.1 VOC family protein [Bradyrhizobium sp. NBAIM32]
MAKLETDREAGNRTLALRGADLKLEVVVIPVSDVDRSKAFYQRLGWRLDADFASGDGWRVVQFTPPGSACSVIFGRNVTSASPGSTRGLYLIVSDLDTARNELIERGIPVSEAFHGDGDVHAGAEEPYLFGSVRIGGVDPKRASYSSFASFSDPDGNGWFLQEVTTRLPGRIERDGATFSSTADLAAALGRAAVAHGEHEKRTGVHDENWPDWYAEYIVREQAGQSLPS